VIDNKTICKHEIFSKLYFYALRLTFLNITKVTILHEKGGSKVKVEKDKGQERRVGRNENFNGIFHL
jgi:hypothetical protein